MRRNSLSGLPLRRRKQPDGRAAFSGIFREGRRLEALSGKLMELIVLGRRDFPLRPAAMGAFLERMGSVLRPALEEAGIQFTVEAEEAPVWLEPDLMETACLNLLDNARKATPEGGTIVLTGRAGEGGGYLIQVSDTGRGIPAEELSRDIVELHGGTLDFESVPGQGTTASIHLRGGDRA